MMANENDTTQSLTFEQAMSQLEAIVNHLQSGEIPLEESIEQFQKGIQLANYCTKSLEQAEQTMTKLMNDHDELEDFEVEEG
ncbi:MAG: exodeoxyribonuclease VII small subunit [Aerococcus sp.]|nr:exodeoxyribonuclease VII small subunit [Aerococcus sp.]